jgi:hypothetical protein
MVDQVSVRSRGTCVSVGSSIRVDQEIDVVLASGWDASGVASYGTDGEEDIERVVDNGHSAERMTEARFQGMKQNGSTGDSRVVSRKTSLNSKTILHVDLSRSARSYRYKLLANENEKGGCGCLSVTLTPTLTAAVISRSW